ncbi:MAG: ATP-binding protein [Magnetococcus sp. YQC-5]
MSAAGKIASGERSARVERTGGGEFGELGRVFNLMAASNEDQYWLQSNLAMVTGVLQECQNPRELAKRLMSILAPMLQIGHGAIYIYNNKRGRIIKNFLSNAFKFTEQGEVVVQIAAAPQDRRLQPGEIRFAAGDLSLQKIVSIAVSDTGIGIAQEKLTLIFEAFQQADGGTNRKYGGTGLGLSIARELGQLLNGELRLRSQEGKGSVFTLLLPNLTAAPSSPPQSKPTPPFTPKPEPSHASSHLKTVERVSSLSAKPVGAGMNGILDDHDLIQEGDKVLLLIEDDPQFATVLCSVARQRGFKTLVALDGESGLALAACFNPSGVILDRTLPGMDGDQVLKRLQANPATQQIPVHVISGREESLAALGKLGAVSLLVKPVSDRQLKKNLSKSNTSAKIRKENCYSWRTIQQPPW